MPRTYEELTLEIERLQKVLKIKVDRELEVVRCYADGHWDRIRVRVPEDVVASHWRDNAPNVLHWLVLSDNKFTRNVQ